jgi:ABC-type uncharacterized transport system substrate-binding protein
MLVAPTVSARQTQSVRRIGYLTAGSDFTKRKAPSAYHQAFLRGLTENGFAVGKNLSIEYRFAEGRNERLPALAAELVERKVEVIFAWSTGALAAAKATRSIPVVFTAITDPVKAGLVQSLAHPGGNVTGLSNEGLDLSAKRLELLKTAVPRVRRIAFLACPKHSDYEGQRRRLEAAGSPLGVEMRFLEVNKPEEIAGAFVQMRHVGADALLVQEYSMFALARKKIAALTLEGRLPTMCESAGYVQEGCLMSYGQDFVDVWRRAGGYVARILKGADPAAMPVEQPTKFELVINMKTAGAFGIEIPESILVQANRVIE